MVNTSTADLRNSLATVDRYNTEFKRFTNYFKFDELFSKRKKYNADGYFKVMSDPLLASVTNGTDVTVGDFENLLSEEIVLNTNNIALIPLTTSSLFEEIDDWVFSFDSENIYVGSGNITTYTIVKNNNIDYTTATLNIYNINTDITDNCTFWIITDTEELQITNNQTITFTITNNIKFKIKRYTGLKSNVFDGSLSFPMIFEENIIEEFNTDMFTTLGKPMMFFIQYN